MTETMQDSGVEWIGAIPKGWKFKRLRYLTTSIKDGTHGSFERITDGIPLLSAKNVKNGEIVFSNNESSISEEDYEEINKNGNLQHGDLLLTIVGSIGRVAIYDSELKAAFQRSVAMLRMSHELNVRYSFYLIQSDYFQNQLNSNTKKNIQGGIYLNDLSKIYATYPPIPEQQAIAQYLDERCGKLDSIITIKKQQIQTLDALRQSIIYQAVTKGLDDSVELVDSGVEWLGEIPKGWKVDKLKRISDIRYGLGQPPASKDDGLPMIRATDVYRGTIVGDKLLTIDPDTLPLGRNPYLKEDEIIVVRSGAYTGDSAIIPAQYAGAIAGYDMVVTVNRANPKFIAYCLLCDYVLERQLRLLMLRAAQPHLNSQELGGILLVLPKSNEEQQKIVDYLDDETQRLAHLKANLTQQIGVLLDYKKSLIYECVTGKKKIILNAG
jgi:type I restriction enzyme S subunit